MSITLDNLKLRSISVQTVHFLKEGQNPNEINWQKDGYLGIEAYEGFNAWYGRVSLEEYRKYWPHDGIQSDLSRFDELIKLLRPIPRDTIYPKFPTHDLTLYKPEQEGNNAAIHLKAPNLSHYQDNSSDDIAMRLLNEARIHEAILRDPHPNLGSYLGCVEEEGRLVRLAFKKYSTTLYNVIQYGVPGEFTAQQYMECIDQVEAAAAHLHSLGLAHNDISPSNIMLNNTGLAILIDFDSCAPLGSPLTKGGLVTGWKGPLVGEGLQFKESSIECDKMAVREIRNYLMEQDGQCREIEERRGSIEGSKGVLGK